MSTATQPSQSESGAPAQRRLNVALITSMKYGLTQFIYRDICALADKGHRVRLFTLINRPGLFNPLPGWEVNSIVAWRLLLANAVCLFARPGVYLRLLRAAIETRTWSDLAIAVYFAPRLNDADVLYAYFGDHKLFVGYYCKELTGAPLVVTIRAYELYRNPNPAMFRRALAACDRIITITRHNARLLTERFGAPKDKIEIVRQIVDLDRYRDEPKIKILIVGFFAEKKGHDVLFRAIRQLERDDLEVWVVGHATATAVRVDCQAMVKRLGIESQVAFFGAQRDNALRALYRECDIFCLPSRPDRFGDHEGFPNVIAEAMAFGKPVVSTRHAGIPEAVDSLLVDENDVDQLADALAAACDSQQLRREVGAANRERAEQMFSPRNADKIEEILQRQAAAGPARRSCSASPMNG